MGFDSRVAFLCKGNEMSTSIGTIITPDDQTFLDQPIDYPLDGGDVHRRYSSESVLRDGANFVKLGQRGPLRLREIAPNSRQENVGMALANQAKNKTDLFAQHVGRRYFAGGSGPFSSGASDRTHQFPQPVNRRPVLKKAKFVKPNIGRPAGAAAS
jgi:hypothetical protein